MNDCWINGRAQWRQQKIDSKVSAVAAPAKVPRITVPPELCIDHSSQPVPSGCRTIGGVTLPDNPIELLAGRKTSAEHGRSRQGRLRFLDLPIVGRCGWQRG